MKRYIDKNLLPLYALYLFAFDTDESIEERYADAVHLKHVGIDVGTLEDFKKSDYIEVPANLETDDQIKEWIETLE